MGAKNQISNRQHFFTPGENQWNKIFQIFVHLVTLAEILEKMAASGPFRNKNMPGVECEFSHLGAKI